MAVDLQFCQRKVCMATVIEDAKFLKMSLEGEIAVRRARRMAEFMRLVCEKESRILNGVEQSTDGLRFRDGWAGAVELRNDSTSS
jgi:hypothetical protein